MMKKIKKLLTICMLVLILSQSLPITSHAATQSIGDKTIPSGIPYGDVPSTIENYVEAHKETTTGMTVAIYDEDGVIYKNNFGYADKENAKAVDDETVFEWGSVSKTLIWVSVMQLVEQGKLDLEEDIQTYLPQNFLTNLTYEKEITMLDLMNHQAGFQEVYLGVQTVHEDEVVSLEDALRKNQPKQIFEPGTATAYSNWGAALAAYIVQNISGMDYAAYVRENIFKPLGMEHTAIDADLSDNTWVKQQREGLVGYDSNGEKIAGQEIAYIILYPAGSVTGTMDEFLTYAQAITPNKKTNCPLFGKQETLELMYTPTSYYGESGVPNNYHGFWANQLGVETIGHGGNTFFCSSMLGFDPDSGIGMIVMTNQAHEQVYNYDMYDVVFGKFTDSELAKIERKVPKGLISFARVIGKGPLSFMKAISLTGYSEEDLNSWWYQDGNHIYGGLIDGFISTGEMVANVICFLLFLLAGAYGSVTIIGGGLICSPIQKAMRRKKGMEINHSFRKWNYALTGIMSIIFADFLVVFIRLNNGTMTGNLGSIASYMVQFGIIAVMAVLLVVCLISGFLNWHKKGIADTKAEKVKYGVTVFLSISMLVAIFAYDMYQFWAI